MAVKLQPGELLRDGRYEVRELIRSVPERDIYLAYHRDLDCKVTVDVFSNNYVMPSGLTVSAWEARVLGQLGDHPNIAKVLEHWENDQAAHMVTRYLSGGRLEERIARSGSGLPALLILQLSTELAGGLAYMHKRGILYRDLQPHNVLFDEWDTAHLVDFDTAVRLDDPHVIILAHRPVTSYMAPELINGGETDERADLYSLGATVYAMSTGRPPFAGTREQILAACRVGPADIDRDDVPAELRDLVFSLLASEPERRPTSAALVVNRLHNLRAALATRERLLSSNLSANLRPTLDVYLKVDIRALTGSRRSVKLPDDHRCLMQAIMALAETDYRRAVMDACTATEVALRQGISAQMQKRSYDSRFIEDTIRDANGIVSLFARYSSLRKDLGLHVSLGEVRTLAKVRNDAAHKGWAPPKEKAIRAVELARTLVYVTHPLNGDSRYSSKSATSPN